MKLDGKWGYINKKGSMVIKNIYEEAWRFRGGLAAVKTNGKWGFIDQKGQIKIAPQYDGVHSEFRNGEAVISKWISN